ncbi:MAG: serine hydrolase [Neisseriaceae bacterium]|nr:MAG: serine hydrolase [Neisseriaceae bacterium]
MPTEQLTRNIHIITQDHLNQRAFAGCDILIAYQGKILYHQSHGWAQLYNEEGRLANPRPLDKLNNLFDIASMTKVIATTQAMMLLLDQKLYRLQDSIYRYLPELNKIGRDINIRQLLTHSSGLPAWKPIYYHAKKKSDILQFINELPLIYPRDTKSIYSDFSFILLGYIIENITYTPLHEFIEKYIFQALDMQFTLYLPLRYYSPNQIVATSHGNPYEMKIIRDNQLNFLCTKKFNDFLAWRKKTLIGQVNDGNAFYAMQGVSGHAGVFSTARDLFLLGELIINQGSYQNTTLYQENIAHQFTQAYFPHRALGWEVNRPSYMGDLSSQQTIGHTGFTGAQVIYDLKQHLQIIILTNRQNMGVQRDGTYRSTQPYSKAIANCVAQLIHS